MEFMMIRSVKSAAAGTSGGDLQKPTLGLISGGGGGTSSSSGSGGVNNHLNNLYQHQQQQQQHHLQASSASYSQANSLHIHTQQQQQHHHQQSNLPANLISHHSNSYGDIKFSTSRTPGNSSGGDGRNNWKRTLFSSTTQQPGLDAFGTTQVLRKKSPMVLPVLIKNKETLDRIANSNCIQNSSTGMFSGGVNAVNCSNNNFSAFSEQHRKTKTSFNLRNNFMNVSVPPNRCKTESKKMNKLLWESSLQTQDSASTNGYSGDMLSTEATRDGEASSSSCRKRKRTGNPDLDINSMFTGSGSKKQKIEKKRSLHMPNLLKWLSPRGGKSGDEKLKKSSDNSSIISSNSFKSPPSTSGVVAPVRTGIPIENIFLKKYDPIRLLKRLRCSTSSKATTAAIVRSVVTPKKKKLVTINNFPMDGNRRTSRKQKRSEAVKGRKKKRKRNTLAQSNTFASWTSTQGRFQVSKKQTKRKQASVRPPRYFTPKRKVNVKYRPPVGNNLYGPHSEDRLRVIAAVYLKRALARLRNCGKVKTSVLRRRLRKMKEWRKMQKTTQKQALVKTENVAGRRSGPLAKFFVTNSKLPSPIPIEIYPHSLVENPFLLHTLQLLRHKRELQDRLETIEADGTVQKVGSLPEKPADANKILFLNDNVPLNRRQVKHVISQKLLICLATVGFTHTKLRPLEVIADATSNFLTKMAQRLRQVSEMEMYGVDHGFPDTMERVLIENGLGGIRGLEEFYRTKVVDYGQRMEEQCLLSRRQYAYKVRSKVGMMSNVNTSTTSNISAASSSSSSVTTISAPSSTITSNNISSTAPLAPPSVMVLGGGGGASTAATGAVASKSTLKAKTSSSSSQPMSPGNSVLAEMLSSQEDLSVRTPQGCSSSPSLGMMIGSGGPVERHLEELMGAPPPNVEIRPNSFPQPHHPHQHRQPQLVQHQQQQQQQQQVPLHQLLSSLSHQQQPQQSAQPLQQQQSLLPPPSPQQQTIHPYVNTLYASSPPLTPPTPPHHLNQKMYQQHQVSPQGQPQSQQSHLTQLLQRPITSLPSPTPQGTATGSHHLILHHHHPQSVNQNQNPQASQQYHHPLHQSHLTSPNQQSLVRNTNISTTTITANKSNPHHPSPSQTSHHHPATVTVPHPRQLVSAPLQLNMAKAAHHSSLSSAETTYSSNTITQPSLPMPRAATNSNGTPSPINSMQAGGGKLITIIRSTSSAVTTQQQGIMVNSNHHHKYQDSISGGVAQDNNVISINLGGHSDIDAGVVDVGSSPISSSTSSSSSSKAKLKEAISQRNLLRLNFEQVPSGAGDSTVLLSSSSVAASSAPPPVANANNSVQFIGKVSGSAAGGTQAVSWNNTTNNYS